MHSWSTFVVRMNHGQTQIHYNLDLGEVTTFPLTDILYVWPWDQHPNVILSQDSQVGISKFSKLRFSRLWKPITLCVDLQLG
jgi:hypothetical protein